MEWIPEVSGIVRHLLFDRYGRITEILPEDEFVVSCIGFGTRMTWKKGDCVPVSLPSWSENLGKESV